MIGGELCEFTVVPLLVCAAFAFCAPASEPATNPTVAMTIAILRATYSLSGTLKFRAQITCGETATD